MIATVKSLRWTIFFSVLLGIGISMITPQSWYDALFPVVTMRADVINKTLTEVTVRLSGEKHRDCKYMAIDAFSRHGDLLRDLQMERLDQPADGTTKPMGRFDFGYWRIWPTNDTKTVMIYVRYDCAGRDVFVRAAEVAL